MFCYLRKFESLLNIHFLSCIFFQEIDFVTERSIDFVQINSTQFVGLVWTLYIIHYSCCLVSMFKKYTKATFQDCNLTGSTLVNSFYAIIILKRKLETDLIYIIMLRFFKILFLLLIQQIFITIFLVSLFHYHNWNFLYFFEFGVLILIIEGIWWND